VSVGGVTYNGVAIAGTGVVVGVTDHGVAVTGTGVVVGVTDNGVAKAGTFFLSDCVTKSPAPLQ
jgi:hypothetical protein